MEKKYLSTTGRLMGIKTFRIPQNINFLLYPLPTPPTEVCFFVFENSKQKESDFFKIINFKNLKLISF